MRFVDAAQEREVAVDLWSRTGQEPFAHPDYLRAFSAGGVRAGLVVDETADQPAVLPLVIRELRMIDPTLDGLDCISPYGYGGPYGVSGSDADRFLQDFSQWLVHHRMCSAFLRLGLGTGARTQSLGPYMKVEEVADNVVVNLRTGPEDLWRSYEAKVRKNVKRARASGCSVEEVDASARIEEFLRVYNATMDRRDASDQYRFAKSDLLRLVSSAAPICSMYFVRDAHAQVVSVELVLRSRESLYSFLGGTLAEAFSIRPNDLLKHEIALAGLREGKARFILGGGYQAGDGIFRYKRSFSPGGTERFTVAKMVGEPSLYAAAMRARGRAPGVDVSAAFFPEYRAS